MKNTYKYLMAALLMVGLSSGQAKAGNDFFKATLLMAGLKSEQVKDFTGGVKKYGIKALNSTPGRVVLGAAGFGILITGLNGCQDHLSACYKTYEKVRDAVEKYTEKHPWIRNSIKSVVPPVTVIVGALAMRKAWKGLK